MQKQLRIVAAALCGVVITAFAACQSQEQGPAALPLTDGIYENSAPGNSVTTDIVVRTTIAGGKLAAIEVLSHGDTVRIIETVINALIPRILDAQSLGVDSITGATMSSAGVKTAVRSAIEQAGGDPNEWYNRPAKSSQTFKLEGYDVIVVGLGGSGMTAYLSAAENGATVYGVEAAAKIGGNSATAGGPMTVNPQTKIDSQNGGTPFFDPEVLTADWLQYTSGAAGAQYAKPDLIQLFVRESGATVDWLSTKYDFHFRDVAPFFHPLMLPVVANYASNTPDPENPGLYTDDDGDDIWKTIMFQNAIDQAKALNPKNDYKLELRATELIMQNGKVAGVKAVYYDGSSYEIYGNSVILATGGFIGNSDMKRQYFGSDYRFEAVRQDAGDGITMAMRDANAGTYNIDMPAMVHIGQVKNIIRNDQAEGLSLQDRAVLTTLLQKGDALVVGQSGRRFTNEADMFGIAFDNWKDGGFYYSIYSQADLDNIKANGVAVMQFQMFLAQGVVAPGTPIPNLEAILTVGEHTGNVVRANTLEELAQKLNTPNLADEVGKYNAIAAGTSTDPFGKDPAMIHPISLSGPYVAILGAGYYYGTCGGLDVDANMQVLDKGGKPIPGLYSVGQDSMGVLFSPEKAYVTYGGAAQGWCITSGRIAGANAAAVSR